MRFFSSMENKSNESVSANSITFLWYFFQGKMAESPLSFLGLFCWVCVDRHKSWKWKIGWLPGRKKLWSFLKGKDIIILLFYFWNTLFRKKRNYLSEKKGKRASIIIIIIRINNNVVFSRLATRSRS